MKSLVKISNTLKGDELRDVMENNHPLTAQIAKELDVRINELRQLGADEKITFDIVNSAKRALTPLGLKMFKVTRNTYPKDPRAKSAEIGDLCHWEIHIGSRNLIRQSDQRVVFSLEYKENDNRPTYGVIASVKSKGWYLEIEPAE